MQERAAFGLGPRPAGTPACGDPGHTAAPAPLARRRVSQGPGVGPSVQVAVKRGPVSRSWPPVLSTLTDRQTDSALDPGGASDSGCGSRNHRSRPHRERGAWTPRAQRTPRGHAGPGPWGPRKERGSSGSRSCKTLWGPRAGEAPVPRGGPGAHGSVRALAGVPLQARFAAAALGAAAGARDAGSAPPSLSCEDRCARHANVIPKTAARSQATPRAGLCSPWSGHAPRTPTMCPSVGTQSGTAPHSREALMTPESRVWQLPLSLPTWGRGTRMEELCAL